MISSLFALCRTSVRFASRHVAVPAAAFMLLAPAPPAAAQTTPGYPEALNLNIVGDFVRATALQADGKMIIAGSFTSVLGVPRNNIARLNADGTLDTTFSVKANNWVYSVAVQADGKIILAGMFTAIHPTSTAGAVPRNHIARVGPDGTVDTTFNPDADNDVTSVVLQPDGKIIIAGFFKSLTPKPPGTRYDATYFARLNPDGSVDFFAVTGSPTYCVALQPDGKILIGGGIPGDNFYFLERRNADGTTDPTFTRPILDNWVYCIAVQPDGRILVGGGFTSIRPPPAAATPRNYIARLTSIGGIDTTFNPNANGYVQSMALQADGRIVVGGEFTTFKPNGVTTAANRSYVARLNGIGTLDSGFVLKPNERVTSVAIRADGKVMIGGEFSTIQSVGSRTCFALLGNNDATQTLSAPTPSRVLWMRGEACPEIEGVAFDLSMDGGLTFFPLGFGSRIGVTADWELLNLTLPPSGQLRAVAHTSSGSRGSGFVETRANFGDAPDIAMEQPAGTDLQDGTSSISFGSLPIGSSSPVKTFTVRNSGAATLISLAVSKFGTDAGDFTVSNPGSTTLTPGGSTTFTVTFTPGAAATRLAGLRLTSNVTGSKNPFEIALTGDGTSGLAPWNQTWFGDPTGGTDGAPDMDPNMNGIPNLLEYALGGDPVGLTTGASILPVPSVNPVTGRRQLTLNRQLASTGITLTVQATDDPAGTWEDFALSSNGGPFSILITGYAVSESGTGPSRTVTFGDTTASGTASRFMRLKVTQP